MRSWISFKLTLVVAAVSVTIIGVFSYLLTSSHHESAIRQVERNALQLSETIKSGTKHDMLINLPDGLQNEIDTIGRQEGIEQIRIFNKDGEITYSSDRTSVGSSVDKRAEACYGCHAADRPIEKLSSDDRTRIFDGGNGHRTLGIINPIYNEPACWQADCHAHQESQTVLGVLDVDMSLQAVDQQMKANRNKVVAFTAIAIVAISVILWLFIKNLVVKPVGRLVEATQAVAEGDLKTKIDVKRKDELGHLAESFNAMTVRLAEVQQQLYQSDKLASLGRLAAGVAHEINNPLTGVLTYSSFLLKRAPDGASEKEDLEIIVRETKRCRQIVKGLLDFSRQVPAKKTNVVLDEVASKALSIVHNRLSFDNITVRKEIPADLPPILADPNQMAQVFINLLVNAADAIGRDGGEIVISAGVLPEQEGRVVEIKVIDNGCGLEAEEVSKVFEPFYTTKDTEGTGLGLAVVWGIVDKHEGTIQLENNVDRGTTVTLRLPAGGALTSAVAMGAS